MANTNMKKDFQKVIKAIREDITPARNGRKPEYPKPMMTMSQMEKSTATVNCGGEWFGIESTKKMSNAVMQDARFTNFLAKWNASAAVEQETNSHAFQIRINY